MHSAVVGSSCNKKPITVTKRCFTVGSTDINANNLELSVPPQSGRMIGQSSETTPLLSDVIGQQGEPPPSPCSSLTSRSFSMEEDKPVLPGINIRVASLEKLVELTVDSFDEQGDLVDDDNLWPESFFLMHKWFLSSEELAQKFEEQNVHNTVVCSISSCQHTSQSKNCERNLSKTKNCHALRYWIRLYPFHFDLDKRLSLALHQFENLLLQEGHQDLQELVDISKVPSYDWMRIVSVRHPTKSAHSRKVSLVFTNLQPDELAEQLTVLEYKALRRITFSDFKSYATQGAIKDNPKLERSIALFNGLSQWVQCMVLCKTTPDQRAAVITKFVNVAVKLRQLQNFNTLMAVVGGLSHSALARLSRTNACLPSETQKTLMEFTELLSSSNNFSNYRRVISQCKGRGFRIPILGVHMKDLISLNTAVPDKMDDSLFNIRKMAQLAVIFRELMYLQISSQPLTFDVNVDLVNTLRLSLDINYTEDEIYELSLAREPRNSISAPPTPTKPVVFADWVSGVMPPDSETINKHVHDMVEAVFKHYDLDRDGFISNSEFTDIAGNFPFIDSFCVLDADQDGMISKAEMKRYFVQANRQAHALKSSFKHNFHETTYFKPTFCIHCTGLLWGIIKQGWKCKECGISAHKHCKANVVMECRSRTNTCTGRNSSVSSNNGQESSIKFKMSQRRRRSRQHKATQTEQSSPMSSPVANSNEEITGLEEFYQDPAALYERLLESEEKQYQLEAENTLLRQQLDSQAETLSFLRGHLRTIRQRTISFILNQMDTLHIQQDTEV